MKDELVPAGVRLRPEIKKRLKAVANERGMKLYEVMQEAFDAYLGAKRPDGPEARVPPDYLPLLRIFSEILCSKQKTAINSLEGYVRYVHGTLLGLDRSRKQDEASR